MSNSVFPSTNITETTNPNPQNSYIWDSSTYYHDHHQPLDFDPSDYLALVDHHPEEDAISRFTTASLSQSQILQETSTAGISLTNSHMKRRSGRKRDQDEGCKKIAIRTKSALEIMDDGFKWRKYGKKMIKSSPYPRNYYKCVIAGCTVKKRVERDPEDSSYVITTYEGRHNHESPCLIYSNQMPMAFTSAWTLQRLPSCP
ncbi:probable WRKY transcription factor 50 [Actinidia eriantha]|uniref:probable WRKY transcription factor 50 n=1 Tax=Actinidia eriantha TaxID=165200 RepID=UPI00258883DA|nr:probable WRKY transcription factor 50 [Actinidia eriantha]